MTDIQLIENNSKVRFQKKLYHESEIVIAKCFNFEINNETGQITATLIYTHKQSLFEFIRIAFKNFSESLDEKPRRDAFFLQLERAYSEIDSYVINQVNERLPYASMLYAHQNEGIRFCYFNRCNFLAFQMRLGKAQPLTAKVCTPSGFVEMGSLKVNDEVIASNGKPHKVTGIFPQGEKEYYRVNFSDGTSTECCGEHLWICKSMNERKEAPWRVKNIKSISEDLKMTVQGRILSKWKIPRTEPVQFKEMQKELTPIHPYLLGVLLGDGCIINTITISTDDHDELIPIVKTMLPAGMRIRKNAGKNYSWNICHETDRGNGSNELINQLRFLGLFNKGSHNKFVPESYLYASVQDRIDLLSGLLDTDGSVSKVSSRLSYSTMSPYLRDAIIFLVQSLGGTATYGTENRPIESGKNNGFFLSIIMPEGIIPFILTRRIARFKPKQRVLQRKIDSVELIGKTECQCISVDSPDHSYLTDSFIVTHNTIIATSMSKLFNIKRTLIITTASGKVGWFNDLTKFWKYNQVYFSVLDAQKSRTFFAFQERFVICNYDSLEKYKKHILSQDVGHIIIDECHRIKSRVARRFHVVESICNTFPNAKITMLSGTAIPNRFNDLFTYFKLTKHHLGESYKKFTDEFTIKSNGRGGEKVTGAKNIADLKLKMSNFMLVKTMEECLDMPEDIISRYTFEMDDYRPEYDKIIKEMSDAKEISALNRHIHSLNIITCKAKIPGIIEAAEEIIAETGKLVIFGTYKEPLQILQDYFKERCLKVVGGVSSYHRDLYKQQFTSDPKVEVFLANYEAGGEALDLSVANDILFINFPLTPRELNQAKFRCKHPEKRDKHLRIHFTFCENSIDEHIYDNIIMDKERDINALLHDGKDVSERENITELLIKKLLNKEDVHFKTNHKKTESVEPKEVGKEVENVAKIPLQAEEKQSTTNSLVSQPTFELPNFD